jgi:hypothetical protein
MIGPGPESDQLQHPLQPDRAAEPRIEASPPTPGFRGQRMLFAIILSDPDQLILFQQDMVTERG